MNATAASFTVDGFHGFLVILAVLCFLAAAIMAWVGHRLGLVLIATGLFLATIALLVTG